MSCIFFREEDRICTAKTRRKENARVPTEVELRELCASADKYKFCFHYFVNKDTAVGGREVKA